MFAQEFLGVLGGVIGIIRQHAQIEAFIHRQRRLIAQHHIQEFQALNMTAQHHETHGERGGEQKTHCAPQQSPEYRRHQHRHRRKTHAAAVDKGFDRLADDRFDAAIKHNHRNQHVPAGIHRQRQHAGKQEGQRHAHIRHKSEQHADQAPQARIGNADQVKAHPDDDAEAGVDRGLQREIACQA